MKLKKRIFSFLAVLAVSGLAILMCTACMSAEEKEKAKEDVREAKPIAEKYLEDNFGGGQVVSIEFMQAKKDPGCRTSIDMQAVSARLTCVLRTGRNFS